MAEPVSNVVLEVVQKECTSHTCPFRGGDGDQLRSGFQGKINKKLEFRVADGVIVREQAKKIKQFEAILEKLLARATVGDRLGAKDVSALREALNLTKKEKP